MPTVNWRTDALAYANACHAAEVEVDVETGAVRILNYVALQDSGVLINPMLVDGQVQGGIAHGIGNALYEWMGYDDDAQPVTTTFADYLLPTATEIPMMTTIFTGDALAAQPARLQGRGRGFDHPDRRRHHLRDRGRAAAVQRAHRQTPVMPQKIVDADPRRERQRRPLSCCARGAQTMNDRIVTVFGGTGFLGRHVVRRLRANGFPVRVASRHPRRADATFAGETGNPRQATVDVHDRDRSPIAEGRLRSGERRQPVCRTRS